MFLLSKSNANIWTILMVFAGLFFGLNLMTLRKLSSCDVQNTNTNNAGGIISSSSSLLSQARGPQHSHHHHHQKYDHIPTSNKQTTTTKFLRNNANDDVVNVKNNNNNNNNNQMIQHQSSDSYNFTAAICVCVRDAEAYLMEWIDYHLAFEFSNIYIYDDSENFELQHFYDNTRNHPIYSNVEIIHYNRTIDHENGDHEDKIIQTFIYRDCVDRYGLSGPKHDYFAFIDVDEFFVLQQQNQKYTGILGVLQDYLVPYGGGLVVNWMLIGDSNKTVYSPLPVTKRFQYRDDVTHQVIKTIAKATDYKRHRNPHSVRVYGEDGINNIHTTKYPGAKHKEAEGETGASDKDRPSDVLLLYHYRYTSRKEYIFKRCVRGQVDRGDRWCSKDNGGKATGIKSGDKVPSHIGAFPGTIFDDTPWQFLKSNVPKYNLYDEFEDFH